MKKKYRFLFICLFIYILLMIAVICYNMYFKNKGDAVIFVDNYASWRYSDEKWSKISDGQIMNYSWKKYDLYSEQKLMGNYYLMKNNYNEDWHIFDDDKNAIKWTSGIVAFGGSLEVNPVSYSTTKISSSEMSYVKNVAKNLDIDDNISKLSIENKYLVDLDDDGINEEIYAFSNAFVDTSSKKVYAIVFMRKNNKNRIIYNYIQDNKNSFQGCLPSVDTIFKVGKDKNPNFSISCTFYSMSGIYSYLYDYDIKSDKINKLLTSVDK